LSSLGRAILVVLAVYFVLKMKDLYNRDALVFLADGSHEGKMFMFEMGLGVLAPMVLLTMKKTRYSQGGLFIASVMVVCGFIVNRLNVSITGMLQSSGVNYFPSWMEIGATLFLVACGIAAFAAAVKYLPIFEDETAEEAADEAFQYLAPEGRKAGAMKNTGTLPTEAGI